MKKKPPDVIMLDMNEAKPLTQWINLAEYAENAGDMYLWRRAVGKIK